MHRVYQLSIRRPRSAANQLHAFAAVDRRDRQTDGRTDGHAHTMRAASITRGMSSGAGVRGPLSRRQLSGRRLSGGRMSGHPLSALWAVGQTEHTGTRRRAVLIHYRLSRSLARRQSPFTSARNQYIRSRDLIHREGANSQPAS